MKRINFEDGQLVTPGYVKEDGTIEEAVYEGDTPLSAFNLNKLQDNIEDGIGEVEQDLIEKIEDGIGEVEQDLTKKIDNAHPVGSIYITSTNTNPASTLGGTWTLVDKEFKDASATFSTEYITLSEGCKGIDSGTIRWNNHTISILCAWINGVTITDDTILLWTFNLEKLGITRFRFANRFTQFSDGGNVLVAYYCTDDGQFSTRDVIRRGSTAADLPAEIAMTAQFEWTIRGTDMLDSFCDKFYWKRTA